MNSQIRHLGKQGEVKGQIRHGGSHVHVLNNMSDLENLDREIPYSFLQKKAEKLSTAVYLITGFLSDNEPIKWQMRECGLSILSDVIVVTSSPVSEISHRLKNITSGIKKITSLFEIAAATGFVSAMNLAILKEEYLSLIGIIENQKVGKPEGGYIFSKEFFESGELVTVPDASLVDEKGNQDQETFSKGHTKNDTDMVVYNTNLPHPEKSELPNFQNTKEDIVSKNIPQKTTAERREKSSRRETILSILKVKTQDKGDRAELSIKDIVGHFSDCGEKTIQRELTALVEDGILEKTGDRRWSRYSLGAKV